MKLEQLVGRIDRIGQTAEEISIHYLAIEDSVHLENLRLMNERLVEYAKVQEQVDRCFLQNLMV